MELMAVEPSTRTGVTTSSGSTVIEVNANTATTLYYYCSIHSGMGGTITVTE